MRIFFFFFQASMLTSNIRHFYLVLNRARVPTPGGKENICSKCMRVNIGRERERKKNICRRMCTCACAKVQLQMFTREREKERLGGGDARHFPYSTLFSYVIFFLKRSAVLGFV